ncbi:DUF935 domain-containing protein [Sesbania bispinosa]|nr:DUF935 domain-containing protein [Sesbania bispinosa]
MLEGETNITEESCSSESQAEVERHKNKDYYYDVTIATGGFDGVALAIELCFLTFSESRPMTVWRLSLQDSTFSVLDDAVMAWLRTRADEEGLNT